MKRPKNFLLEISYMKNTIFGNLPYVNEIDISAHDISLMDLFAQILPLFSANIDHIPDSVPRSTITERKT